MADSESRLHSRDIRFCRLSPRLSYFCRDDVRGMQLTDTLGAAELRSLASSALEEQQRAYPYYFPLFAKTGQLHDLDHAIKDAREHLSAEDSSSTDYGPYVRDLVTMLMVRFQHGGALDDLQEAILRALELVVLTPAEHKDRGAQIADWICLMLAKCCNTGAEDDLDEAMALAEEVGAHLDVEQGDGEGEAKVRITVLVSRKQVAAEYEADTTADDDDISDPDDADVQNEYRQAGADEGSTIGSEALNWMMDQLMKPRADVRLDMHAVSPADRAEMIRLTMKSSQYRSRFEIGGNRKDLDMAIMLAERCLAVTTQPHSERAYHLSNLGLFLGRRAEELGCNEDLDRAIAMCREATEAVDTNEQERSSWLHNYGYVLGTRFEWTGDMDALGGAIHATEQAVETVMPGDLSVHEYESSLGVWLRHRFERLSMAVDIERAIQFSERAVAGDGGIRDIRAGRLGNLANCLQMRFLHTGDRPSLDRGITTIREAVRLYMPGRGTSRASSLSGRGRANRHRWSLLAILANLLRERSKLNGASGKATAAAQDADEAMTVMEEVIALVPDDHHGRAALLRNLSMHLTERFRWRLDPADLDQAIAVGEQSIAAMDHNHRDYGEALNTLGIHLVQRAAVAEFGMDIGQQWETFECLWKTAEAKHRYAGDHEDSYELALTRYREAWACRNMDPTTRIIIAQNAAKVLAWLGRWAEASRFLAAAVQLLPRISPRSLQHADKQRMLADYNGLAAHAAAAALQADQPPEEALHLLELGRGVIAGLLMELRSDLSELHQLHPDLAAAFTRLRDELDAPSLPTGSSAAAAAAAAAAQVDRRLAADSELDQLLDNIHAQPGFDNFLRLSPADMRAAAHAGPIVVLNLSFWRCDAFIVEAHRISALPLPALTFTAALTHARYLHTRPSSSPDMASMLSWLWEAVACPVLDALGFVGADPDSDLDSYNDELPQIWWVPTGVLSRFPIHAAADKSPALAMSHHHRPATSVLDRVMSSYASSIRMLIHTRKLRTSDPLSSSSSAPHQALLVAMDHTPGLPYSGHLLSARGEVDMLAALCPDLNMVPVQPSPRRQDVLRHLASCRIFHFAGHGLSDPHEPARSCLLLEDWQACPLTVGDLRDQRLQDASESDGPPPFLGYLSACSTSANEATTLADESIHLVGALQLAGFRHVVGSLWEVSDDHCVIVASHLYHTLRDDGLTDRAVCRGLHRALRALRDGSDDNNAVHTQDDARKIESETAAAAPESPPTTPFWVPYVHFGV